MGTSDGRHDDWVIPAVLVGIAVAIGAVVAVLLAVNSAPAREPTAADEFEAWSRCLRAQGAPVPLVEALRDGGFRLTFDAETLDGDVDPDRVASAFDTCADVAPDVVEGLVGLLDVFGGAPFSGGGHAGGPFPWFMWGDPMWEDWEDGGSMWEDPGPPWEGDGLLPDLDEVELEELCGRVLDRLDMELPVPPRLRRACELSA